MSKTKRTKQNVAKPETEKQIETTNEVTSKEEVTESENTSAVTAEEKIELATTSVESSDEELTELVEEIQEFIAPVAEITEERVVVEEPVQEVVDANAFISFIKSYCDTMDFQKNTVSPEQIATHQGQLFSNLFLQLAITEDYDRAEAIRFLLDAIDSEEYNALTGIYLYRCVDRIQGPSQDSLLAYSKFLFALTELADPETRSERFAQLKMETFASKIHPNALALVEELGHVCTQ